MSKPEFGVIFDVDGVLIDSYSVHLRTWQICCERHGRECTEAQFVAGFGRTSREVIRETWPDPPDDDAIAAFDEEKEILYRELVANEFPHMPGARDLINALHSEGVPMAIGSSGPPKNVALAIRELQAEGKIQAVITGADVRRGKPHPDVFLMGAAGMELPPTRCIVLEDSPPGIEAALAAGSKCLGIVSRGHEWDHLHRAHARVMDNLLSVTPSMLREIVQQR